MERLIQDMRYGARMMAKTPAFTAVAVFTLALGIGANTAIFSIINAVMIRQLPVRDPQQLVVVGDPARVHSNSTGSPRTDLFSVPLYQELQKSQDAFDGLAATGALSPSPMVALEEAGKQGEPQRAHARLVSANFFSVLGVDAVIGRVFRAEDEKGPGSDPLAVISYNFWRKRFNQDPGVVGRTMRVNGFPLTIVGIMPQGFAGEVVGDSLDFWAPIMMQPQLNAEGDRLNDAGSSWLLLIGRLRPGVSLDQAKARLNVTYKQIAQSGFAARFGPDNLDALRRRTIEVSPGGRGLSSLRKDFSRPLTVLMLIVGLVLLIACVNVANLMLARSAARKKEIAVRLAIGASAARIVRQVITESLMLALLGGVVGLLAAQWGIQALLGLFGSGNAIPLNASPDRLVLGFTLITCALTGVLFGSVPAMRARRTELALALNSTTRGDVGSSTGRWSVGRLLVAAQVAVSVLVLFAGALLVHSLANLHQVRTGYDKDHLLLVTFDLQAAGYKGASSIAFSNQLLDRLRALPGVSAATFSGNGLFSGSESADALIIPGFQQSKNEDLVAHDDTVGANYFASVGIPLVMGRDLNQQDIAATPKVAVVNQEMAHFYWGSENPIGRSFVLKDEDLGNVPFTVVGVSRDVRDHDLRGPIDRRFYQPASERYFPAWVTFEVRASGAPTALKQSVIAAIKQANPTLDTQADTAEVLVDDSLSAEIFVARLSGFFAGLALLLSCVGLYGITAYAVAGRTREIGVRMALGAQPGTVLWMVLREALLLVGVGVAVGIPAAVAGSRVLRGLLFEVSSADPRALAFSLVVLGAVAAVAALVPARRAAKVDPMVALRYE